MIIIFHTPVMAPEIVASLQLAFRRHWSHVPSLNIWFFLLILWPSASTKEVYDLFSQTPIISTMHIIFPSHLIVP